MSVIAQSYQFYYPSRCGELNQRQGGQPSKHYTCCTLHSSCQAKYLPLPALLCIDCKYIHIQTGQRDWIRLYQQWRPSRVSSSGAIRLETLPRPSVAARLMWIRHTVFSSLCLTTDGHLQVSISATLAPAAAKPAQAESQPEWQRYRYCGICQDFPGWSVWRCDPTLPARLPSSFLTFNLRTYKISIAAGYIMNVMSISLTNLKNHHMVHRYVFSCAATLYTTLFVIVFF